MSGKQFSTHTNIPVELTFTALADHPDPFNQVMLDVFFTEPDGTQRRVPAFWAGGRIWKVRYASPLPGLHRWYSQCSNTADAGLHEITGTIQIEPYTGGNPLFQHGPVRIAQISAILSMPMARPSSGWATPGGWGSAIACIGRRSSSRWRPTARPRALV
jgi:hypothetical protein